MNDASSRVEHTIPPVYDSNSRILILGSFPSVKSRESQFFYGHPKNRFWRVLANIYNCPQPETVEEKKSFLISRQIALWDVIASCRIEGSSDSSIRNAQPNDIASILNICPIERIFANGKTAYTLYNRFIRPSINRDATLLPSTSPANASWSLEQLILKWRVVL